MKSFAVAIALGTFLLMLPAASRSGQWTNPVDALFTATSATCVTGLIVVDTGGFFSAFGQGVILALIQVGGLGIMTLGTCLLAMVGKRISLQHEQVVVGAIGKTSFRGLKATLLLTILFALICEMLGMVVLALRFAQRGIPVGRSVNLALFHAVSAFCNAGFSLFADSLVGVREDGLILGLIGWLIILGGLGFPVIHNIASLRPWRRDRCCRRGLSLHSRMVLVATVWLIGVGWLLFALLEWQGCLGALPWTDRLMVSLFQAVTPRTAGFNAVDMSSVSDAGVLLTMVLMFIGGGSASAAGGIKVSTAVVLWVTVSAMVRGRRETVFARRALSVRAVRESVSIVVLAALWVVVLFGLLLLSEQGSLGRVPGMTPFALLFELVSAFGTVGLSTGLTAELSTVGKLLLVATMFAGRLGPMTLALVIARTKLLQAVSYPEEDVFVG